MGGTTDLSRRRLLLHLGPSPVAVAAVPEWLFAAGEQGFHDRSGQSEPDIEVDITSQPPGIPILPGRPTKVWRFSGELVKGPPCLPGLRPIRRVFSSSSVKERIICTLRSLQAGSCAT